MTFDPDKQPATASAANVPLTIDNYIARVHETLQVTFHLEKELHDLLFAELSDYDFNAFEAGDDYVRAYGPGGNWTRANRRRIRQWLEEHGASGGDISERWIRSQNWNEKWAREIEPVVAGPFYVKSSWHEVPESQPASTVIEVDPKMTFGTGHHASTRLVLQLLPDWVEVGDRILDAGAGTGILGVAAVKLGADEVVAFDNHPAAREHAVEVFQRNGVADRIDYRTGEIDAVPESGFSGILANINRNVVIDLLPHFASKIAADGFVILSGLMKDSRSHIQKVAAASGLQIVDEAEEGEWVGLVAVASR